MTYYNRFDTISESDGQTRGLTDRRNSHINIACHRSRSPRNIYSW